MGVEMAEKKSIDDVLSEMRQANGWSYEEANSQRPLLTKSVHSRLADFMQNDLKRSSLLREWFQLNYAAKGDSPSLISWMQAEFLTYNPQIATMPDESCTRAFPMLWDVCSPETDLGERGKTKLVGPLVPASIWTFPSFVAITAWFSPQEKHTKGRVGHQIFVLGRNEIEMVRRIKLGTLWATVPGFQLCVVEEGERIFFAFGTSDGCPGAILDEVEAALRG